jgi:hypothetical protein
LRRENVFGPVEHKRLLRLAEKQAVGKTVTINEEPMITDDDIAATDAAATPPNAIIVDDKAEVGSDANDDDTKSITSTIDGVKSKLTKKQLLRKKAMKKSRGKTRTRVIYVFSLHCYHR